MLSIIEYPFLFDFLKKRALRGRRPFQRARLTPAFKRPAAHENREVTA
jgi:hypothetical protein